MSVAYVFVFNIKEILSATGGKGCDVVFICEEPLAVCVYAVLDVQHPDIRC